MEYRHLGRSGLKVSVFGFGVMTFGGLGRFAHAGDTRGEAARRQIDMCLEAGVNLFDTADIYSDGDSEVQLSEALGERRKSVLIATKFFSRTVEGVNGVGGSRHHIIEACEASLKRLKTDYIDLYQIHCQDPLTPPEETLRALDDLVRAGKVRYIGCSNHSGWWEMKALATSDRMGLERYVSQQIQYSLLVRDAEDELLPLGVDQGVGAIIWGPTARGYLSGKFRHGTAGEKTRITQSAFLGGLEGTDTEQARRIVDLLDEIAAAHPGASANQVALNWVARKSGVTSILIGARTDEQLTDNLAAATWSLSDEEMARLDEASATPIRYPYIMHRELGRERYTPPRLQPPIATA